MSRIDSEKINLGSSFVLATSDEQMRAQELINARKVANDIVSKAQQQAQQLLADAQQKAQLHIDNAVEQAKAQVEEIVENAKKDGYQQGYEAGQNAGRQDLAAQIEAVDKFVASEFEIKKRIIKSAHNDIVNLVTAIADKICQKKLDIDDDVLYNITKCAINCLKDKETVKIFVNPNMARKIYDISESLKQDILSLQSIRIVEDSSVSEDGTIVESISSRVDSRVSSQIDEIVQKMLLELYSTDEAQLVAEIHQEHSNND